MTCPRCSCQDSFLVSTLFSERFYECARCHFVFGESEVIPA